MIKGIKAAMLVIILLVSNIYLPVAYAQPFFGFVDEQDSLFIDPRERYDLGEVIAVNVKSYEPTVVTSNVIADDYRASVYVFLEGYTLGSLFGQDRPAIEPLYGEPVIRTINIRPANGSRWVRGVRYIRPGTGKISLSDLGTVQVILGSERQEEKLPDVINIEMVASIWMEAQRLVDFGEQSLLLPEDRDDSAWRNKNLDDYAFWNRFGYIRASQIDSTSARIDVYDGNLRPIVRGRIMRVGETLSPLAAREIGRELLENRFRIRLDSIVEPGVKTARIKLMVDGENLGYKLVKEGQQLYAGSEWYVKSIEEIAGVQTTHRIILKNKFGDERQVDRIFAGAVSPTGNVCQVLADNKHCKAIDEFTKLIEVHGSLKDSDGYGYSDKANYWIGRSYEELANLNIDAGLVADARQKAVAAYAKVVSYNLDDAKTRLNNMNDQIEKNAIGGTIAIVEGNQQYYERNIELSLINVDKTGALEKPSATIAVDGGASITVNEGQDIREIISLDNGVWYVDDIKDNSIVLRKRYSGSVTQSVPQFSIIANQINQRLQNYDQYIKSAANKYGVDENLIKAVICWEHRCLQKDINPDAVSPKGAVGIMQVLPSTAKEVSGRDYIQDELRNPELSIDLGTAYIKKQLSSFNNNEELALAAYNWGPGRVINNCGATFSSCRNVPAETFEYVPAVTSYKRELDSASGLGGITTTLFVGRTETVDKNNVKLISIELKKQALFTILPGDGRPLYSESRFSLHIPVEKRAIGLTPDKIDSELNKTQERIDKLDGTISKLEDLVKKWKTLCLITFAYLTLKNSFFSGLSRSTAREKVMNEEPVVRNGQVVSKDGIPYSGWKAYCSDPAVLNGPEKYTTYDNCIGSNAVDIRTAVDKAKEIVDDVNNDLSGIDDIRKKEDQIEFGSKHGLNERQMDVLVKYNEVDAKEARDLTYLKHKDMTEYNIKLAEYKQSADKWIGYEDKANSVVGQFTTLAPAKKTEWEQLIATLSQPEKPSVSISDDSNAKYISDTYKNADLNNVKSVERTFVDENGHYTFDANGKIMLNPVTRTGSPVVFKDQQVFVNTQGTQLFLISSTGELRGTYAVKKPAVEYNEDYTPYLVPIKNRCTSNMADYIKVEHNNARPVRYDIWNVGADGQIDIGNKKIYDDKLHYPDEAVRRDQNLLRCAESSYNDARRLRPGQQNVRIQGEDYIVSYSAARLRDELNKPRCSDVMDPRDCQILYNICDPVMCPVSRFNLGGRWQLPPGSSVAETGIIGSLILGLPNWDISGGGNVIPPVCMTGVLAGLKNLRSVLLGYQQCLLTAKVDGESIGICDRIRSVYACEILWKEALLLFKVHGSLVGLFSKALGETAGGGEYLTFENSVENAADSVEFFTRDYASTAFAAYQSRSTAEVGTEICRAAIFGEFPGIGNIVDEIARPENPPQFTAILSTMPWSPTAKQFRYGVFYHIYAGSQNVGLVRGPLRYSVFLRNPVNGRTFGVTERCDGVASTLQQEGFAQHNLDCTADEGFTEVCVSISGRTQCGFGKVSSNYALNYVNDQVVASEAKKNIDNAEECKPDDPRYSTGLGSFIAGNPGIITSGIVRFCSVPNPGSGSNPDRWTPIGDCGKDIDGRLLGSCWLDTQSVSIKDTQLQKEVFDDLNSRGFDFEFGEDAKRAVDIVDKTVSDKGIEIKDDKLYIGGKQAEKNDLDQLLIEYGELINHYDEDIAANARFMLGVVYFNLAEIEKFDQERIGPQEFIGPIDSIGQVDTGIIQSTTTLNVDQGTCEITSARWGVAPAVAVSGQEVEMIVEGENCGGEYIVAIYEDDGPIAGPRITYTARYNVFFEDDVAKQTWIAKWQRDWLIGDPEYYFEVYRNTLTPESMLIRSNNLKVIENLK